MYSVVHLLYTQTSNIYYIIYKNKKKNSWILWDWYYG